MLTIDWEGIAKNALSVAEGVITSVNPLAGIVVGWAGTTAFAIVDQQKALAAPDPVAAAQLAGDKVADLVEALKLGTAPSP
ncbi:MAG: hypothetical protein ACHQC8_07705 [Solirubrobacterales bacterium]